MSQRTRRQARKNRVFHRPGAALVRYSESGMPRGSENRSALARLVSRSGAVFIPRPVFRKILNRVLTTTRAKPPEVRRGVIPIKSLELNRARVCAKRQVRREVLHALRIAGKTGLGVGGVRRTAESKVRC